MQHLWSEARTDGQVPTLKSFAKAGKLSAVQQDPFTDGETIIVHDCLSLLGIWKLKMLDVKIQMQQ